MGDFRGWFLSYPWRRACAQVCYVATVNIASVQPPKGNGRVWHSKGVGRKCGFQKLLCGCTSYTKLLGNTIIAWQTHENMLLTTDFNAIFDIWNTISMEYLRIHILSTTVIPLFIRTIGSMKASYNRIRINRGHIHDVINEWVWVTFHVIWWKFRYP